MSASPVYLDYQATTPMDPRVAAAMRPYMEEQFGNPHSSDHAYGWEAQDAVKLARSRIAQLIHADDDEIVFTSGATESCNMALRGAIQGNTENGRTKVVTVQTEHPAVFETVTALQRMGLDAAILPVGSDGLLDLDALEREVDERTLLVSVMAANNEIGVIQPLHEIGLLCRAAGALFHIDGAQATGRMFIDVDVWQADLLSVSAHKVYGPKGVGALYCRDGTPLQPLMTGGTQESGLRPGTVPTALAAGFGKACELAEAENAQDAQRMIQLTKRLEDGLREACPGLQLFGHPEQRVAGNLNIGFPGIRADEVVRRVADRIAISSGSACASATSEPSRILLALGLHPDIAATAVRISLGRFTNDADIDAALAALADVAALAHQH